MASAAEGGRGGELLRRLPKTHAYTAEEVSEAERVAAAAKAETAALAAEAAESKQTRKVALAQLHTRLNKVCRQPVVRREAQALGLRLTTRWRYDDYDVAWFAGVRDVPQSFYERKVALFPHRLVSRLPRARESLCKTTFARLLEAFYRITPPTCERRSPRAFVDRLPAGPLARFYITKPDLARGGSGIRVWQAEALTDPVHVERQVVQEYIDRPMLLDGYKFDLRVYVLVASTMPLRAYLYQEGLVRVCTELYEPPSPANIDNACMHLTNYAVNKTSAKFRGAYSGGYDPEEDAAHASGASYNLNFDSRQGAEGEAVAGDEEETSGNKQTLTRWLQRMHAQGMNTMRLMAELRRCLAHSLVALEGMLAANTSIVLDDAMYAIDGEERCCHLLGCDVMFDADGRAWMLEVNTNPSLLCGTAVDWDIKEPLAQSLVQWLANRSAPMVRHLTAHDALVDREARAHNAKLIAAPGGRDTPIHLLAGGSGVGRPKQRTCSGQVVAPKPVASAYQRASVPPMAPRALAQPAYFEDLGPLLEPLQLLTPFRGPAFVNAFRRLSVQARPKAMREARSLAVVPVELLFSTICAQWETLCMALDTTPEATPRPESREALWPASPEWLSVPTFADASLMLARYLLGMPLASVLEATREEVLDNTGEAVSPAAADSTASVSPGLTRLGRTVAVVLDCLAKLENDAFVALHEHVLAEMDEAPEAVDDDVLLA